MVGIGSPCIVAGNYSEISNLDASRALLALRAKPDPDNTSYTSLTKFFSGLEYKKATVDPTSE